jgi:hypothetical protein
VKLERVEIPASQLVVQCHIEGCPYNRTNSADGYGTTYGQIHEHFAYGDYQFAITGKESIQEYDGPLFKWVNDKGQSSYGGNLQWDLPKNGQPGAWQEPDSKLLSTCKHGLHALLPGQRGFGGVGRLFVAEAEGPVMFAPMHGKVVAMKLRLVREVDFSNVVTDEMVQAYWKERTDYFRQPGGPFSPWVRALIKDTREATIKAARRAARPLLVELRRINRAMKPYEDYNEGFGRLEAKTPIADWQPFYDLYKERSKVRRKLRQLDNLVSTAQISKPRWDGVKPELVANPDVALYLSKEVPDVDPPTS